MTMKWVRRVLFGVLLLVLLLATLTWFAGKSAQSDLVKQYPPPGQLVDAGGFKLHIHCVGERGPSVVMDAGLNEFSVQWAGIQSEVAKFARACVYDRAGLGWSEMGSPPRTSEMMVKELHTLLGNAGIAAPYLLVGHSFGGMNMRLYTQRYPSEVRGMVLVDAAHEQQPLRIPGLQTAAAQLIEQFETLARFTSLGLLALSPGDIPARGLSGAALAQYRALLASTRYFEAAIMETQGLDTSFAQVRDAKLGTFGTLPLRVLSRGQPDFLQGVSDADNLHYQQVWKEMQLELAALSANGRQIVATQSAHYIHLTEPQLVIDAIRSIAEENISDPPR